MRTVVLGDPPPELADLIDRRRALGQDLYDEVWEGEYHMAPAPHGSHGRVDFALALVLGPRSRRAELYGSGPANVGAPDDYRVPDLAFFADPATRTFYPTAEVVLEIVSPDDESRNKLGFYHRVGIKEVGIIDPAARTVEWFARADGSFRPVDRSVLLDISAAELAAEIDWPR